MYCSYDKNALKEIRTEYKNTNIGKRFHPSILLDGKELEILEAITYLTEKEFSCFTAGDIGESDISCSFTVKSDKFFDIEEKISLNAEFKTLDIEFNENDLKKEIKSDVVTFYFKESNQKFIVCNKEDNLYCDNKEIRNNKQLLQEFIKKEIYYLEDCKFINNPKVEIRVDTSLNNIKVKDVTASNEMYQDYLKGVGIYSYNWYYDKNDIQNLLNEIMGNDEIICYSKVQEQRYNIYADKSSAPIFCGNRDKNLKK